MGIRVKKVIGYGLTDVKTHKKHSHRIIDERFDPEGYARRDYSDADESWEDVNARAYREFLEKNYSKTELHSHSGPHLDLFTFQRVETPRKGDYYGWKVANDEKNWWPGAAFVHEGEFGLPNVCVVVPYCWHEKWTRSDDTLDYHEEAATYDQKNRVVELRCGIYPYIQDWADAKTHEPIKNKHPFEIREMAEEGLVVPRVPPVVRSMCRFLKIFKEEQTINELRPLLYVYWS